MKAAIATGLGAVLVQSQAFEPADFNATQALIENGVDVSNLSLVDGVFERSGLSACSAASGTLSYSNFTGTYWSAQQGSVSPACVFLPSSSLQVSTVVLVSRLTKCSFAVKGGGHAAFAGASSIEGGITVSMERFNHVVPAKDKKTVDVGPGNRWVDVYEQLESAGIGVAGGRMAPVGVPGLLLGGGITFFSNKIGWACDNVASYDLVTASGVPLTVSPTSHPDLYWALRGGGNNFGIVTNFKLEAFPLGMMWGGQRLYGQDTLEKVLDAAFEFATEGSNSDPDASVINSFTALPEIGPVSITQLEYAQPIANASVFSSFNAIPHIQSSTDIRTLAEITIMMSEGSKDGLRQTQWNASFKVSRLLFSFLLETFYAAFPELQDVEGFFPTISIQVITEGQLKGMQKNGGNALGLDPKGGPYFIMNMSGQWANASDDSRVLAFFSGIIESVKAEAKKTGADNSFMYVNYASQFNDPIGSYGEKNLERLRAVSKEYDPKAVFQKLQPGHFKLEGGPPHSYMP
ncbi:FAD-binding domain-containing protein [Corynespora cassiicola Philippines]|uniref:FAD-binding domain-containing protein n=1 Tax=Corynespora cassiicola Philippines TaxID=1448308 RepID=A0A2T2N8E5_CORCC|nr:FAD-binding domain-containing protein [Corynespora cassiicola Philippines]